MDKLYEEYMCCIFAEKSAKTAYKNFSPEYLEFYGSECNGHSLHTWDHGERMLARCKNCGKLLLIQQSEYISPYWEETEYFDIYPVRSEAEAQELNEKYNGFELESHSGRRALFTKDGNASWH